MKKIFGTITMLLLSVILIWQVAGIIVFHCSHSSMTGLLNPLSSEGYEIIDQSKPTEVVHSCCEDACDEEPVCMELTVSTIQPLTISHAISLDVPVLPMIHAMSLFSAESLFAEAGQIIHSEVITPPKIVRLIFCVLRF